MRQFIRRESDPTEWERRNRKIARLVKSGKTMEEIGVTVGISRERVRKLLLEMGIKNPYKTRAAHRHRKLTRSELEQIRNLYGKRTRVPDIPRRMELDLEYLYKVIAKHRFIQKYRCIVCGKGFVGNKPAAQRKYCDDCSADQYRLHGTEYQRMRYRTDAEFRRKKLALNDAWKKSPAGKKWHARYRKETGNKRSK